MGGTRAGSEHAPGALASGRRARGLWAHLDKPVTSWLLRQLLLELDGLDQAGAALLAQPIAVAADGDDVAVVEEPVEDGGGGHWIAENRAPFAHGAVAGDEQAVALVAARDELEEQMRGVLVKGQIAGSSTISSLGLA